MSEESNERYVLEVGTDVVLLIDTEKNETLYGFTGPNRLLAATAELNRLKEREEDSVPAAFLAETLPAVARRQRLESRLARVREVCECADAETMRWTEISTAASVLRERLEKELSAETRFGKPGIELDTPSGPLSVTETAQNAPEVRDSTRTRIRVLDGHAPGALGVLLQTKTRYGQTYRVVKLDGEDFDRTYLASLIALSATETAQNAPEVLVDAQIAEGLQSASEALDELFSPYGYGLNKPGPY